MEWQPARGDASTLFLTTVPQNTVKCTGVDGAGVGKPFLCFRVFVCVCFICFCKFLRFVLDLPDPRPVDSRLITSFPSTVDEASVLSSYVITGIQQFT